MKRQAGISEKRPRREGHSAAASSGIVLGRVRKHIHGVIDVPRREIPPTQVDAEISRLRRALDAAVAEIDIERKHLMENGKHDALPLLDAHRMLLSDAELLASIETRIENAHISAEWALHQEIGAITAVFDTMEDEYLRERRKDIEHTGNRILKHLMCDRLDQPESEPAAGEQAVVYVGDDFSPADVVSLWRRGAAGIVAERGGADAHNIIVARGIGLPALVGAAGILDEIEDGDTIILDAERRRWVLNPSEQERTVYQRFIHAIDVAQQDLALFANKPSLSQDGHTMALMANIEVADELILAKRIGIDGIGLYRTELLFLGHDALPDEQTQYQEYARVLKAMPDKPVTMRLLDIGGDKTDLYRYILGRDFSGSNPAMGLRGVRLLLKRREWLEAQLRALLRAGREGQLRILIPMVIDCDEVLQVREILDACRRELGIEEAIGLGVMIEVPAAVMIADQLAQVSDFFSIGTNDLMQYTLAVDRTDEDVADLYSAKHPAIEQMIRMTVGAAKKAGIPVNVCGELAADPSWTETFLRMGMDALSMSLNHILKIRRQLSRSRFQPAS